MSQWSGPQSKGASRGRKAEKRIEAERRQRQAILSVHSSGVCDCKNSDWKVWVDVEDLADLNGENPND